MSDGTENLNLTLHVESLVHLFDVLGYPNSDDPDNDWGPVVRRIGLAALNPQPLPPRWILRLLEKAGPQPDPCREIAGPRPELWQGAPLARD